MSKRTLFSIILLSCLPLTASAADADKPLIMISLRCCEGDPKGTLENGKLKVLSAPKVVTESGQTAKIVVGGTKPLDDEAIVDFGLSCELKPTLRKDGKVLLEVNFTATELVESDLPDQVSAVGTALRSASLAKPGEMKILGRRGEGEKQRWLEATVEVVKEEDIK
jgi:hypothetical protein